jgi:hypothetical protein
MKETISTLSTLTPDPEQLTINPGATEALKTSILKVFDYYLSGKGLPSKKRELLQQIGLAFVCLSGATLYIFPAKTFADEHGNNYAGDSQLSKEINYILGTTLCALVVLYVATDAFFNIRHNETIPEELKQYLNSLGSRLKDWGTVIGAGISSVPLALVSLAYPLPIPLNSRLLSIAIPALIALIIGVDNTVLHFLPLRLAMMLKVYRLPILPFEMATKKLYQILFPSTPAVPNPAAEEVRNAVVQYLLDVQNKIRLNPSFSRPLTWRFENDFKTMMRESETNYLAIMTQQFPQAQAMAVKNPSRFYQILSETTGVGTALLVWSGCSGYLMEPFNQLMNWTGNAIITGTAVTPALYFLSVLLTFFGYNTGKNIFHYLTQWGENDVKLPLASKLYPKAFAFLMLVNVYINLFSYAAAEQLVHDNFKGDYWDQIKPFFIWAARIGLPLLGIHAIKDFSVTLLQKWAMYFGENDTQFVARLDACIGQLVAAMAAAKPEILSEGRGYCEKLGILKQEEAGPSSSVKIIHPPAPAKQESYLQRLASRVCFWRSPVTEESSPLIEGRAPATGSYTVV